jgi:mediator of RNA polymerase II transcription subunit 17
MPTYENLQNALVFPQRQRTRLRVSLGRAGLSGERHYSHNTPGIADDDCLEGSLMTAQQEVVEQEIFSLLVREASNQPTASVRVSERLIVIDAGQGMELRFELVRQHGLFSGSRVNAAL